MKKILFLLVGILTVVCVSCKEDEAQDVKWFATPVTQVSGTSVDVSCRSFLAEGHMTPENAGFAYALIDQTIGDFTEVLDVTVKGSTLSCRLTGLDPESNYIIYAFVDMSDVRRQSPMAGFITGTENDPDPDPDPDPSLGLTFGAPTWSGVTASGATVNCTFGYTGEKPISEAYFAYSTSTETPERAAVTTAAGDKSAQLSGLRAQTEYTVWLCVVIDGQTHSSSKAKFSTAARPTDPSGARYAGWAELPVEQVKSGDYYYAYHMRADAAKIRNYSVCYSAEMHCAVWVACPMHKSYTEGSAGGQNKSWKFDPSIPTFVQPDLSSSYQGTGDGAFSRGHMVASADRQVTKETNKQTFYYTNMAPQIQNGFNSGIWSTLEGWCRSSEVICSDTLYMVTGSYFGNRDRTCKDNSNKTVIVPTHFYKVLIRSKSGNTKKPLWELPADQIQCVGFWFDHKTYSGSSLKPYMKSVAEIEATTGVTFFPNVPNAPKQTVNASDWNL